MEKANIVELEYDPVDSFYTIDLMIRNIFVPTLIDTGANINLISQEIYEKIKGDEGVQILENSQGSQGTAIDGSKFNITRTVVIPGCYFKGAKEKQLTLTFGVLNTPFCKAMISLKSLKELQIIIDTGQNHLVIPNKEENIRILTTKWSKQQYEDLKGRDKWDNFITAPKNKGGHTIDSLAPQIRSIQRQYSEDGGNIMKLEGLMENKCPSLCGTVYMYLKGFGETYPRLCNMTNENILELAQSKQMYLPPPHGRRFLRIVEIMKKANVEKLKDKIPRQLVETFIIKMKHLANNIKNLSEAHTGSRKELYEKLEKVWTQSEYITIAYGLLIGISGILYDQKTTPFGSISNDKWVNKGNNRIIAEQLRNKLEIEVAPEDQEEGELKEENLSRDPQKSEGESFPDILQEVEVAPNKVGSLTTEKNFTQTLNIKREDGTPGLIERESSIAELCEDEKKRNEEIEKELLGEDNIQITKQTMRARRFRQNPQEDEFQKEVTEISSMTKPELLENLKQYSHVRALSEIFDDSTRQKEEEFMGNLQKAKLIKYEQEVQIIEDLIPIQVRAYFFRVWDLLENKEFVAKAIKAPTLGCPKFNKYKEDNFNSIRYCNYLPIEKVLANALAALIFKSKELNEILEKFGLIKLELIAIAFIGFQMWSLHEIHLGESKSRYTIRAFLKNNSIEAGEISKLPTASNQLEEDTVEEELLNRVRRGIMIQGQYSPFQNLMSAIRKKPENNQAIVETNIQNMDIKDMTNPQKENLIKINEIITEEKRELLRQLDEEKQNRKCNKGEENGGYRIGAARNDRDKEDEEGELEEENLSRDPQKRERRSFPDLLHESDESKDEAIKRVKFNLEMNQIKEFEPGPCQIINGLVIPIEEEMGDIRNKSERKKEIEERMKILFKNEEDAEPFLEQSRIAEQSTHSRKKKSDKEKKDKLSFYIPPYPRKQIKDFKGNLNSQNFLTNAQCYTHVLHNCYERNNPCYVGPMADCYDKMAGTEEKQIKIGGVGYKKKEWAENPVGRKRWMRNARNIIQTESWKIEPKGLKSFATIIISTESDGTLKNIFENFDSTCRAGQGKKSRKVREQGDQLVKKFTEFLTLELTQGSTLDEEELRKKTFEELKEKWEIGPIISRFLNKTIIWIFGSVIIAGNRKEFKPEKLIVNDTGNSEITACALSNNGQYAYRVKILNKEIFTEMQKNLQHHEIQEKFIPITNISEYYEKDATKKEEELYYEPKLEHIGEKCIKKQAGWRFITKNHNSNANSISLNYEILPTPAYTENVAGSAYASTQFDLRDYYSQIPCDSVAAVISCVRCKGKIYFNKRGAQGLSQSVYFAQTLSSKILKEIGDNLLKQVECEAPATKKTIKQLRDEAEIAEEEYWGKDAWKLLPTEESFKDAIPENEEILTIIDNALRKMRIRKTGEPFQRSSNFENQNEMDPFQISSNDMEHGREEEERGETMYKKLIKSQNIDESELELGEGKLIKSANIIDDLLITSTDAILEEQEGQEAMFLHLKIHALILKQIMSNLHYLSKRGKVMKINPLKSNLASGTISFLSKTFVRGRKIIDPNAFQYLREDRGLPQTVSELQSFAASVRYIAEFLQNLSPILHSINEFCKKGGGMAKIDYEKNHKLGESIALIKKMISYLTSRENIPTNRSQIEYLLLSTDASQHSLAWTLLVKCVGESSLRNVANNSVKLVEAHQNLPIFFKELLAMALALKANFGLLQFYTKTRIIVLVDNSPLCYLLEKIGDGGELTSAHLSHSEVIRRITMDLLPYFEKLKLEVKMVASKFQFSDYWSRVPPRKLAWDNKESEEGEPFQISARKPEDNLAGSPLDILGKKGKDKMEENGKTSDFQLTEATKAEVEKLEYKYAPRENTLCNPDEAQLICIAKNRHAGMCRSQIKHLPSEALPNIITIKPTKQKKYIIGGEEKFYWETEVEPIKVISLNKFNDFILKNKSPDPAQESAKLALNEKVNEVNWRDIVNKENEIRKAFLDVNRDVEKFKRNREKQPCMEEMGEE